MKQPIFVYYELDNFYQNHRRYDVLLRFSDWILDFCLNWQLYSFLMLKFHVALLKLKSMMHRKLTATLNIILLKKRGE
jgi:hypothetical protein